jgi:hypothetical protein
MTHQSTSVRLKRVKRSSLTTDEKCHQSHMFAFDVFYISLRKLCNKNLQKKRNRFDSLVFKNEFFFVMHSFPCHLNYDVIEEKNNLDSDRIYICVRL